ncbi:MAG: surface-adhesin E family protein, partial [Gallionellaceae bacterium]
TMAQWIEVGSSADAVVTVYADPATISKVDNKTKMWDLGDFKTAQDSGVGTQFMSIKGQSEYDCKEEQYRTLYSSYFSGNMGKGEIIGAYPDPEKWMPVQPNT